MKSLIPDNLRQRLSMASIVLLALAATSIAAADSPKTESTGSRKRAIQPLVTATVTGKVTDAQSGANVVQADIVNGGQTVQTKPDGTYSIDVPNGRSTVITAQRYGYAAASQTVTPSGPTTLNFRLSSKPPVTITDTSGGTFTVDLDVAKFGYLSPFSGYISDDKANFCKPDGTAFTPDKSEFQRIVGPGTSTTNSSCCNLGPVVSINVEMKNGDKTVVYFNDSCFGAEVDFISRDHASGQFLYFNFTKIARIEFP